MHNKQHRQLDAIGIMQIATLAMQCNNLSLKITKQTTWDMMSICCYFWSIV